MTDLQKRPSEHEEIEAEDDTPKAGDYLELKIEETIRPYERDSMGMPKEHYFFYTDADGPVITREYEAADADEEFDAEDDEDEDEPDEVRTEIVTRWVFMAVTHVGSNYLLLRDLHKHEYRVHLDEWHEECRKVVDADARIQQSVNYWQNQLTEATGEIGRLMQAVGIEGQQLAADTQALAVKVGSGPADEHKTALAETKDQLPVLYKSIARAGKNMGKWMAARALPLQAMSKSLESRQASIDSRLLAVDLYAGLSEEAVYCRKGKPAEFNEKLHLMQRMHYMDEECLANYTTGGMDFRSIGKFDKWLAKLDNFERLLPHKRCAVAFRVRRDRKARSFPQSWADFLQIALEEEQDKRTFLYIRNGKQLWRVECEHDFGEVLFPDLAHSTLTAGVPLWAKQNGTDLRTQASLEQEYGPHGEDWLKNAKAQDYEPFNDTSVYFDDIQAETAKMMAEYNRVAVLLQGLLDRSQVLHPHPPVRLWNPEEFDGFVTLMFDQDRALVSGPAPDFDEFKAELAKEIHAGSFTLGQERIWWDRERLAENDRRAYSSFRDRIYEDNDWWWPGDSDPGPGFIAEVVSMRGGQCRFNWERQGRRQKAGSERWGDDYPTVKDHIKVSPPLLFNVSAYKPGDFKRFFADPRTRADYLKWAPILLAAEEFHAQGEKYVPPLSR